MEKQVLGPGVVAYKNAIPKEWNLISRLESSLANESSPFKWRGAKVGYFESDTSHRNCQDFIYKKENLGEVTEFSKDLMDIYDQVYASVRACLDDYCATYKVKIEFINAFNMVKYGPGEKFNSHSDDGEPFRCTVSCVGYINDDYQGGELKYDNFDLTVKPDAGDFVLFPSSYVYSHASLPIKEGVKYAIVIMTDITEFAHRNDSPIYHSLESRQ